MANTVVSWVSDKLYELLGLSDKYTAEFLVGLAGKAQSPEAFVAKLRDTGAISFNDDVKSFAAQLWQKLPRKQAVEKQARAQEREVRLQQQKNKSYRLLSDPEDEEVSSTPAVKETSNKAEKSKKRKNLRTEKASAWDSGDEETPVAPKKSKGDSDSDEWEKYVHVFLLRII